MFSNNSSKASEFFESKINYDNETIPLNITLKQIGNNGSLLVEKIQEAINKPKPTPGDDEDFG